jgi:ribosomal protein L40E
LTGHAECLMLVGMYCPHCGAQNAQDTKFCRGCGEDLRLVSQAVTKSLPLMIARRVDEAIDRGRGAGGAINFFAESTGKHTGRF